MKSLRRGLCKKFSTTLAVTHYRNDQSWSNRDWVDGRGVFWNTDAGIWVCERTKRKLLSRSTRFFADTMLVLLPAIKLLASRLRSPGTADRTCCQRQVPRGSAGKAAQGSQGRTRRSPGRPLDLARGLPSE